MRYYLISIRKPKVKAINPAFKKIKAFCTANKQSLPGCLWKLAKEQKQNDVLKHIDTKTRH